MSTRNPSDNFKVHQSFVSQELAAGTPTEGTGVDTTGFEMALVIYNVGDNTGGTGTLELQTSDLVGGTYADLGTGNPTLVAITGGTNDDSLFVGEVDLRYLPGGGGGSGSGTAQPFLNVLVEATTAGLNCGVTIVLFRSRDVGRFAPQSYDFRVGADIS